MKGAQLGVSEWAINFLLHTADTKRAGRGNGLWGPNNLSGCLARVFVM